MEVIYQQWNMPSIDGAGLQKDYFYLIEVFYVDIEQI